MRTKVAEFWNLPDNMSHATRTVWYRRVPDGEGTFRWSHVDKNGVAHLIYDDWKKIEAQTTLD